MTIQHLKFHSSSKFAVATRSHITSVPICWLVFTETLTSMTVLLLLLTAATLALSEDPNDSQNWAVLVALSSRWTDYRHQADICHAYQILHKNGIPDERIIVMMYDNIANNTENNLNRGNIINRPKGPDVYKGVLKDYTGGDVTPRNFLAVLTGDQAATPGGNGKVLRSGPNDHVFIYISGHGAKGLIGFPNGLLSSTALLAALNKMHRCRMYSKLVFYLEACESGSMFVNLPANINIYSTTASNPTECSWAYYCVTTPGMPCLGDEYSIHWLEHSDAVDLSLKSLDDQFQIVKRRTKHSNVHEYGDLGFKADMLINYQGDQQPIPHVNKEPQGRRANDWLFAIPVREIEMTQLHMKLRSQYNILERHDTLRQIVATAEHQIHMINTVQEIVHRVTTDSETFDYFMVRSEKWTTYNTYCYELTVIAFSDQCYQLSQHDYATGLVYVFENLCNQAVPVHSLLAAIDLVC